MSRLLAVLSTSILLLAACSSPQPAETGAATPVPPPSAEQNTKASETPKPAKPTPTLNDRGNAIKKVGEWAYLQDQDGKTVVKLAVTKVEVDPKCTAEFAEKPKNGHYIALTLDVQTTKDLASADIPSFDAGPYTWKVISPEGTTENESQGNGYTCMPEKANLTGPLGPGQHAKGLVVLDSAHKSGGLVLVVDPVTNSGWEWGF